MKRIWQFHYWFDELSRQNRDGDRFLVFLAIIATPASICTLVGLLLAYFGYIGPEKVQAFILFGWMIFFAFGLTRMYWIIRKGGRSWT